MSRYRGQTLHRCMFTRFASRLSVLHWLSVYYRISYKLSLLTWKALYTAEPSYLSELISPYAPTRTVRTVNTGLLVLPTDVTSHFASRSFSVSSPSVWNSLYLHTSVLLIISLHLSAILNHTFSSQLSPPSPVSYTHLTLPTNREV